MKFTFDENKINIFTLIPYGKMREEGIIKKCIESWKKIPNSVIYLLDMQDIKDTFPGMVENDVYYKKVNSEYLKPGEEPTETVPLYDRKWDIRFYNYDDLKHDFNVQRLVPKKECNLSTDVLRLKLLQEIPNSVYCDSDMYIFDVEEFMKVFNSDIKAYKTREIGCCPFAVKKGKERSFIIDEFIEFYNKLDKLVLDSLAWLSFTELYRSLYIHDVDKLNALYNFETPCHHAVYLNHLFGPKCDIRTCTMLKIPQLKDTTCKKEIHVLIYDILKWDNSISFLFDRDKVREKDKTFIDFIKNEIIAFQQKHLLIDMSICYAVLTDERIDGIHIYRNPQYVYGINDICAIYQYYKNDLTKFKEVIKNVFLKKIYEVDENMISNIIIHELIPSNDGTNSMKIIEIN